MYDRNHQRFIKVFNCESEYSEKMDLCKLYSFFVFSLVMSCVCAFGKVVVHTEYGIKYL